VKNLESVPGIQATTIQSYNAPDAPDAQVDEDMEDPNSNTEMKFAIVSICFKVIGVSKF